MDKPFVVFCDIDGVLTTPEENWREFNAQCVANMKTLLATIPAIPVIHSTWRLVDGADLPMVTTGSRAAAQQHWAKWQLPPIHDFTPAEPHYKPRSIETWLRANPVSGYLIIDDEDYPFPKKHFLKTTWTGLTDERLREALFMVQRMRNSGQCK
jgi:hypothetical protein